MKAVLVAAVLILAVNSASVMVPDGDTPKCEFCKAAIREFKVILTDKNTIAQLDMIGVWFCANFPIQNCDKFWADTLKTADDWVAALNEDYVCKKMEECPNYDDEPIQSIFSPAAIGDDDPFCEYCHLAMNELKKVSTDPDVLILTKDLPKVICDAVDVPGCLTSMTIFFKYGLEVCQNLDVNKTCINWTMCKEMTSEEKDTCAQCTQVADLMMTQLQNKMNLSGRDMCGFVGLC